MKFKVFAILGFGMIGIAPAIADDVRNTRLLLCASVEAHVCLEASECKRFHTESLEIPRFIKVDTQAGTLTTTAASGDNRQSTAEHVTRTDGRVILQGFEKGRAYSFDIEELTGLATFSASEVGRSITVFGACTPADTDQ